MRTTEHTYAMEKSQQIGRPHTPSRHPNHQQQSIPLGPSISSRSRIHCTLSPRLSSSTAFPFRLWFACDRSLCIEALLGLYRRLGLALVSQLAVPVYYLRTAWTWNAAGRNAANAPRVVTRLRYIAALASRRLFLWLQGPKLSWLEICLRRNLTVSKHVFCEVS